MTAFSLLPSGFTEWAIVGLVVFCVTWKIVEWFWNNKQPVRTQTVRVVRKEIDDDSRPPTCHMTFALENGKEHLVTVSRFEYERYQAGVTGTLTPQGTRY